MKYLICLLIIVMSGLNTSAQVTMGSGDAPHPGAVLELKSENKGFLGPKIQLQSIKVPSPVQNPANGLLVFNIGDSGTGANKVEKDKFYFWSDTMWVEFVYEEVLEGEINELIKDIGIPRSAVFHLNGEDTIDYSNRSKPVLGMYNVMAGLDLGQRARLYFKETNNETEGNVRLYIDQYRNSYLFFKKGTYSITFTYQFIPSVNAYPDSYTPESTCTASSYFVDFPLERNGITQDRARIHNVAYHMPEADGHHGGSIGYVTRIEVDDTYWEIRLGAGQSGANCNYNRTLAMPGFSLMNDNTFVLVSRIGD